MTGTLASLSDSLAEAVASAGPSVVRVEGRRRLPASGIVWSADGVIVTAHHVLERDDITIGLPDNDTATATLVGRDPTTDVAVLRIEAKGLTTPTWADLNALRVGHLALALGRPGQSVRATLGIASAVGKSWRTPGGGQVDTFLQTDAAMYPGFSGGPLVDASGHFLGLNTTALLRGINVAVPQTTLRRVVESLLAHGRVRRGYLGVGAQSARLPETLANEIKQETGLLLVSIETGSPAEQYGLLMGDTVVSLDGEPVRQLDDLLTLLGSERLGKTVPVRVIRGGQIQEITVTVGEKE